MKLTDVSVDNRTSVLILVVIIFIMGLTSYISLPREAAPDVQIPLIIVSTPYFGVAPADIESLITQPIEKELNGISEIKTIRSSSNEGYSLIQAEFESGYNIDDALQKVRDKVDKAESELPNDVEKPEIIEINFSEFPIMIFNLTGPQGLVKLKDIAEDVKDELENIEGILEVKISGGLEREVQVNVDIDKLIHYNIRFDDVINTIRDENRTTPGGIIDVNNSSFLVRIPGEFDEPYLIQDLIVKMKDGSPIYVRDVADVNYAFEDRTTYARLNGSECVSISISKRLGANIIFIAEQVKQVIGEFEKNLPDEVEFILTVDFSKDIKQSVRNLENNIFSGLILVLLVLFSTLGLRNAALVATAIPLSMLISFIILSAINITLNFIVLFSLILALGMLVDNAIVIIENIYKFLEEGNSLIEATKAGAKEVAWPITTSTLTTLMVFSPLLFWPGVVGDFMIYLPITLIVTLSSSLFVALVINPVFGSKFMKLEKQYSKPNSLKERIFDPLRKLTHFFAHVLLPKTLVEYEKVLVKALKSRLIVLGSAVGSLIAIIMIFGAFGLGVEFFPDTDPERVFH
jgi:multidrug efflux pump